MNQAEKQNAPAIAELAKYGVNVANVAQVITQPLYHYQPYEAAGVSRLTFFQNPVGSNVGGTNLTMEDTNMEAAGQLPNPKTMLVLGIQFQVISGADVNQTDPALTQTADLDALLGRGHVQFFVGSKAQYDSVGMEHFPTNNGLVSESAIGSTAGILDSARYSGPINRITPLVLPSNQNFKVTVDFPNGLVAMPSGQDAVIGCKLIGYQYRLAQ